MRIGGLQKTTLLDFPGKVGAVVFIRGCNFLCPYCHNPDLVLGKQKPLGLAEVKDFLARRRKVLEGVVISGGEPTLWEDLPAFCVTLKSLGYAIKLDTNGSRPDVLRALLAAGLLDYVAMDVKGNPWGYPETLGARCGGAPAASMKILRESGTAHEFRIPCAAPFIDAESFAAILDEVGGAPVFLQAIRLEHALQPEFFRNEGRPLAANEMEALRAAAGRRGVDCRVR